MRRTAIPIILIFLGGCWTYRQISSNMYLIRTEEGYRVVGFVPAEPLRESAYFFVLLAPLRLYFATSKDTVPVYADLHTLTMDKQRRIDRAFLVSAPMKVKAKEGVILMERMGRVVGKIYPSIREVEPHINLDSVRTDTFRGKYHIYAFITAVPAARNYPTLLAVGKTDTLNLIPVERARYLTKYRGRQYHMYQEWYDRWTFVARSDTPVSLAGRTLTFVGELFGSGDTSITVRSVLKSPP